MEGSRQRSYHEDVSMPFKISLVLASEKQGFADEFYNRK